MRASKNAMKICLATLRCNSTGGRALWRSIDTDMACLTTAVHGGEMPSIFPKARWYVYDSTLTAGVLKLLLVFALVIYTIIATNLPASASSYYLMNGWA
jgi:hypothetical protein